MEDKNSATIIVLAAIERNGGNLSFNELEKSTGLSFVELSNIIGQLMKENRLLARVNHFAEAPASINPRKMPYTHGSWTCCSCITVGREVWHSTHPRCASPPNT